LVRGEGFNRIAREGHALSFRLRVLDEVIALGVGESEMARQGLLGEVLWQARNWSGFAEIGRFQSGRFRTVWYASCRSGRPVSRPKAGIGGLRTPSQERTLITVRHRRQRAQPDLCEPLRASRKQAKY
jgi:hypothetical protein